MAGFTNPMSPAVAHRMGVDSPIPDAGWSNPMRPGILGRIGAFSGGVTHKAHYYRLLRASDMIFVQNEATAARRRVWVYLVDATDGLTPETAEGGGQPQISKNGAAWGNTSATLTAVGNGTYYVELTQAELDTLGKGFVRYKSANTVEFSQPFDVVAPDMYGTPNVNMVQISGDETAANNLEEYTDGTTPMPVNTIQISASTTAADNLQLFFDGTGYNAANSTVGTVTNVTNMVTANVIQVSGDSVAADTLELFAEILDQATGQLDSGSLASGTITAASIATDAIGAAEVATDLITEISTGVWAFATRTITGLTAAALADFFDTNSGTTYASSVAGSVVKEIVDSVAAGTETILHSGTAQDGGAGTITLDTGASANDDHYQNTIIALTGGTGQGQSAIINSYDGTTKVATVTSQWAVEPDSTTTFKIFPFGAVNNADAGAGALTVTITAQDAGSNPIDGVAIWLTTDEEGNNVVHGPVYTTAMGIATFHLDAGTYFSWKNLGGWNFTNPQQHEVS